MSEVEVIGAGLAGCEAALQCARRGVPVRLQEMRPDKMTEAHETGDVAELVCSNSLKSDGQENAHGLLKAELRVLGSVLLECAERARIPGGKALVVDRRRFSVEVQSELSCAGVSIERAEVSSLSPPVAWYRSRVELSDPHQPTADLGKLGTVPQAENRGQSHGGDTSTQRHEDASRMCPRCSRGTIAGTVPVFGPVGARQSPFSPFFEGCLPVEELARRGRLALAFGPMKPVGLVDPRTGKRPYAVMQLRRENAEGTMYNLVGFQTRLKQGEQERVFRMIPGLEKATFLRFGSIHRNTFLDSPKVLLPTLQTRVGPDLLVAGQLTGVEGYVESIGAGLVAGINAARLARGDEPVDIPREMMLGSLLHYITSSSDDFQPMNANFGLLPPLEKRLRGRDKRRTMAERALDAARAFALTVAENRA